MSEILDKISSYNIFNYLLPGTLFAVIADKYSSYSFIQDNTLIAVFSYYFIGLVISRFGSLLIEPLLKKIRFLKFAEYNKYVIASKDDKKLEVLSEVNNMYRTLCSLFVSLLALMAFDWLAGIYSALRINAPYGIVIGLIVLFLFSYRKQTSYIAKRVNSAGENKQ
jgi:predicted histidine transporter YuiF (NhaC family)